MITQEKYNKMSSSARATEDWMNRKWRPYMAWMYMAVCIADFIVFPIFWSIIQVSFGTGEVKNQWNPLTLQGAGLFHIAMGVVLGLTTWGRTQEKINGVGYLPIPQPSGTTVTTTYGDHGYRSVPTSITKPSIKPNIVMPERRAQPGELD